MRNFPGLVHLSRQMRPFYSSGPTQYNGKRRVKVVKNREYDFRLATDIARRLQKMVIKDEMIPLSSFYFHGREALIQANDKNTSELQSLITQAAIMIGARLSP